MGLAIDLRAEAVVAGSGPGGAITACLLAEAGREVILIEEGYEHGPKACEPFSVEEMALKYRNGGLTPAFGRVKVAYVEGRCVGGGSEVNSGLYHRTPTEVLERWAREYEVEGLEVEEMLPHFEAIEKELSVSHLPTKAPTASLKLHEGAEKLGWKSLEVPRWSKYGGEVSSGQGQVEQRQTMSRTFLPRFQAAGGKLMAGARVERLRHEGGHWVLHGLRGRDEMRVRTENLFLCAGAVHTPTILKRSGITRNVGRSLRLHPTIKITARFQEEVNQPGMGVPVHQVKEFAPRLSFGCSISTPAYLALGMLDGEEGAGGVRENWRRMANYYAMTSSEARGSITPVPFFKDPLVRYELAPEDLRNLADGLRKLSMILFEAGATALYPSMSGFPEVRCLQDLNRMGTSLPSGRSSLMSIHLFSSCPMGEAGDCATDSFGRMHGFKGLYVNDASLLCTAPGVNPQGSVMAIARRNALNFLGR